MRSRFVPAVAMASALVAFAGVGSVLAGRTNGWSWNWPTGQKLRVATAPLNDGGKKFFATLKEEMAAQRTAIQLSLVETADLGASARALREQKVDAAVIRSDDPAAAEGRTLFVLRNLYVALLVPATAPIDSVSKLKGKKIGVLVKETGVDPMAKVVLDYYGIEEKHVARLALQDLPAALQRKQVSAVMVVGSTGAGPIVDAIEVFRRVTKKPPNFVDISEAKAMAERFAIIRSLADSDGDHQFAAGLPAVACEQCRGGFDPGAARNQGQGRNHAARSGAAFRSFDRQRRASAGSSRNGRISQWDANEHVRRSDQRDPADLHADRIARIGGRLGQGAAKEDEKSGDQTPDAAAAACAGGIKKCGPRAAQCIGAGAR